jgi:copper(I)-binding protein
MKIKLLVILLFITQTAFAFMSGIDERRDTHGELETIGAYIPMAPSGMMNAGYLKFKNVSNKKITFHQFTSPVYDSVQIHATEYDNGVAKMKHADTLVVPAKSTIELKPGNMHLMLIGPRRDIKEGEEILMIGQDYNERRYMLKFLVVDPRNNNENMEVDYHHNH